jgi:hypothetical protein
MKPRRIFAFAEHLTRPANTICMTFDLYIGDRTFSADHLLRGWLMLEKFDTTIPRSSFCLTSLQRHHGG